MGPLVAGGISTVRCRRFIIFRLLLLPKFAVVRQEAGVPLPRLG